MENLGDSREKIARRPEVDKVKGLMGVDFFKNSATEKETKAKNVIRSFNMQGIETIDDLFNRTEAPNYNQNQAKEKVNILATAIYETMQESGDKEVIEAAISGSFSIAKQLPPAFIGEDRSDLENGSRSTALVFQNFVDKFATETDKAIVYNAMENFDYIKNNPEIGIETGEAAKEALEQIKTVSISGKDSIESRARLVAYLSKMSGKNKSETEKSETINGNEILKKIADDIEKTAKASEISAKQAAARYELEHDMKTVSLGEQVDAYLYVRAPRERAPQQWEYDVPDELRNIGFNLINPKWKGLSVTEKKETWNKLSQVEKDKLDQESWRQLLSFMDQWLGAIYTKRYNSADYNNRIDAMSQSILNLKGLNESDLKKWYENPVLNLKGVMRQIARELLTETEVPGIKSKAYVFEIRDGKYVEGSYVEQFVNNEDGYKRELVKRLTSKIDENGNKVVPVVGNEVAAKLSVALAMNVMEMGGVFSFADGLRKLGWESDALRLSQRPERKYRSKITGGELFGGPWTEWANVMSEGDEQETMRRIDQQNIVPLQLAGSFLDMPHKEDRDTRSMMERIYNDPQGIKFDNLEKDMFFGWRKDHIMPAARIWMYVSGKNKLELSKTREVDAVISEWRSDLYNDIMTLRKCPDSYVSTDTIKGAIGGAVGLWPFEGPYLRINNPGVHGNGAIDYGESVIEIIRQLGLGPTEQQYLLSAFGVDKKNYKDLSDKFVAYTAVRNMTLPGWYRAWAERTLLKQRPV